MATKTRAEMIAGVLSRLGVLAVGQSPTDADSAFVGGVIDSLHDRMRQNRLAPYPISSFPAWVQLPFTDIAAEELLADYGVGGERAQLIMNGAEKGRTKIVSQLGVPKYSSVPVKGRYF